MKGSDIQSVLCPYCGAEMSDGWHENGLGRFGNYLCQECFAKSPDVAWPIGLPKDQFDTLNKAAALRRYTPPITAEKKLVCPINGAPCSECKPGSPCGVEVMKDA